MYTNKDVNRIIRGLVLLGVAIGIITALVFFGLPMLLALL